MKADDDLVTMVQHRRLVGRVDAVDGRLSDLHRKTIREITGELAACKRAIAALYERGGPGAGDERPVWLGNSDPQQVREMLTGTWLWVDQVGKPLGLDAAACWPWHTGAVAVYLAASRQYRVAVTDGSEVTELDYVTRHMDAVRRSIRHLLGACNGSQHFIGETSFLFDRDVADRLPELAGWYVTGAEGLPPGLRDLQSHVAAAP